VDDGRRHGNRGPETGPSRDVRDPRVREPPVGDPGTVPPQGDQAGERASVLQSSPSASFVITTCRSGVAQCTGTRIDAERPDMDLAASVVRDGAGLPGRTPVSAQDLGSVVGRARTLSALLRRRLYALSDAEMKRALPRTGAINV
jgi:hypothetical protein